MTTEIVSRRVFTRACGAVAAVFVLPGCAADDEASANPVNAEWEELAAALEATGAGLYTAGDELDQPGKAATHVPAVTLDGRTVTVTTTHVMSVEAEHFIQYHYVRDEAGVIFALREYVLGADLVATMTFEVPAGTTRFTVHQHCNLHWTWTADEQAAPA